MHRMAVNTVQAQFMVILCFKFVVSLLSTMMQILINVNNAKELSIKVAHCVVSRISS